MQAVSIECGCRLVCRCKVDSRLIDIGGRCVVDVLQRGSRSGIIRCLA
jgi:hypothetical protein